MSEHSPVLEARNLSVYHSTGALFSRKRYCVEHLTFHIHAGEIIGLAGPSGSGKSSIGKAVLGLIPTWEGDVYWGGRAIRDGIDRHDRRSYGWIGQEPALAFNPRKTLLATLTETLRVHGLDDSGSSELRALCDLVAIDYDILHRYPFEVSGGQVQRCALIRVLMLDPRFLVLDEPTSSLDPLTQMRFFQALLDWRRHHSLTVMVISHSADLLGHLCHAIIDARPYHA